MDFISGKVILIGDSSVGKTAILNKYLSNNCATRPTIGANSNDLTIKYKEHEVNVNIWDTAGQDAFKSLIPMYARNSQIAVLVYDQNRKDSFDHLPQWIEFLSENATIPKIIIVANKEDLEEKVDVESAIEFANAHGCIFLQTSALSGHGIDQLFYSIAEEVYNAQKAEVTNEPGIGLEANKSSGCC